MDLIDWKVELRQKCTEAVNACEGITQHIEKLEAVKMKPNTDASALADFIHTNVQRLKKDISAIGISLDVAKE